MFLNFRSLGSDQNISLIVSCLEMKQLWFPPLFLLSFEIPRSCDILLSMSYYLYINLLVTQLIV
jgi:hypothetical protein